MVADGQFSTLGIVLLAALARLTKVTGIDRRLKNLSEAEKKESNFSLPSNKTLPKTEDVGEPVHRTEDTSRPAKDAEVRNSPGLVVRPHDKVKKARTAGLGTEVLKKKKRKNAIDDLFAGVL